MAFTFDETIWMGGNPMSCIQNKRGTGRAILLTLFLAFLLPAGAAPAQAAGGTSVSMDGKDVNSSTVVVLPKDAAVAFSLKLNGTYGKGYTSGNGTVAQTGTVQRFADGQAVYAVKAGRERGSVHRRRKDFGNENCSGSGMSRLRGDGLCVCPSGRWKLADGRRTTGLCTLCLWERYPRGNGRI